MNKEKEKEFKTELHALCKKYGIGHLIALGHIGEHEHSLCQIGVSGHIRCSFVDEVYNDLYKILKASQEDNFKRNN